ncbi:50S ribosomal protein L21 [Candidatus Gracilibacteria bacterium]|nr:50S ribosomal protein L21 [Candidatus Gracilibacteria bacterium]
MIAVVEIGGKQYSVEKGQIFDVDNQNLEAGKTLEVTPLLLASKDGKEVKVGTPLVEGASVKLKVIENYKAEKVNVFKIIAKKRHTRNFGFRAMRTRLEVTSIA